jgi:hypothetical protein
MSVAFRKILVCFLAVFALGAVAASAASAASNDEWEVSGCAKVAAGSGLFTNSTCETLGAPKEFAETGTLGKLVTGKKRSVTSSGTTFTLTALGKVITCTTVTDKGTITGGKPGTDLAESITFMGCATKQAGCGVHSAGQPIGTIVATNIPTKLEQRKNATGKEIVVDNFEQNATTKEFVTLKFEAEAGKSCSEYTETKVKGTVAAEAVEGTGELNFPATALEKDTLEAFGIKATLAGKDTQKGVGGGKVQAS